MARVIAVILLAVALLGVAIFEEIYLHDSFHQIKIETAALVEIIENSEPINADDDGIDTTENIKKIDDLYNYWVHREKHLCLFTRHFDLMQISDAIIYTQNFIHEDNREEALAGINRLSYLLEVFSENYSTNIRNIF